jgi:ADP-heptose:LPS heptosyltransferase
MKILIIQTASIGDVILVTPMVEALQRAVPLARVDLLVKRGMEELFENHPFVNRIITWDKGKGKYFNLIRLAREIRRSRYDQVITVQRYFSGGLLTALSGAPVRVGFNKNPLSPAFTHRLPHTLGDPSVHEVDRNISLLAHLGIIGRWLPKLHIPEKVGTRISGKVQKPYICVAPSSLWATKQYPEELWVDFLNMIPHHYTCYVLGSSHDTPLAERIRNKSTHPGVIVVTGKDTLLETAARMRDATMNYTNDSAPLHLASATNAPVTAIFCSTVPSFGFGPLSEIAYLAETPEPLPCRPCGVHGKKTCPEKHFLCARSINPETLFNTLF